MGAPESGMLEGNDADLPEDPRRGMDQLATGTHESIRPRAAPGGSPRPIGLSRGAFTVPASFFDPLPEDLLVAFEGGFRR